MESSKKVIFPFMTYLHLQIKKGPWKSGGDNLFKLEVDGRYALSKTRKINGTFWGF